MTIGTYPFQFKQQSSTQLDPMQWIIFYRHWISLLTKTKSVKITADASKKKQYFSKMVLDY